MKSDKRVELLIKHFEKKYQKSLGRIEREIVKSYLIKEKIIK
ncbi:hypothetical protein [Alkalihalobacillus sp. 1P02AB]